MDSFDQLANTVLELAISREEHDELFGNVDDDPTPTLVADMNGPGESGKKTFRPKHRICGPETKTPSSLSLSASMTMAPSPQSRAADLGD